MSTSLYPRDSETGLANVLIFLHGLACWLGHLGRSFRRAAVGFRLEIQGDEVVLSGLAGGFKRKISSSGEGSGCLNPRQ
jgi:hypothetical protein